MGPPEASDMPLLLVAGSLNLDLVGRAPHIPAPGETVLGAELQRFHGGKGGNQAVAAARLGARVRMHGALGQDAAGDELLAGLAAEGIEAAGVQRCGSATGAALITVSAAGDNAITVLPGANRHAPLPDAAAWSAPASRVGLLLLQLEIPMATNLAWAEAARAQGVPVLLNAAPMDPAARTLLPLLDGLVVNEGELQALLGGAGALSSPEACAEALAAALAELAALGPRRVVVTLGAAGCAAWADGRLHRVRGHSVPVVDTTGAGDTFVGALAAALLRGAGLPEALSEANLAAALACTRAGARAGMPTRAELLAAR